MNNGKHQNEKLISIRNTLFIVTCHLLVLTLLSMCMVSGTFAKYVVRYSISEAAHVASSGGTEIKLLEHEAIYDDTTGEYEPGTDTVSGNAYLQVIPGVDIFKDPFVQLDIDPDLPLELYLEVTDETPDTVTFSLTDDWIQVDGKNGIYKYKTVFNTAYTGTIQILKDNELIVSQYYDGEDFTLSFQAWLTQQKPN